MSSASEIDHHQHLFGPAAAGVTGLEVIDADALLAHLDEAGMRRAVVLSVAYTLGKVGRALEDEHARVREENDWTSEQVARGGERLRGFCGVNPLKEYALEELARCVEEPQLRHLRWGLKLHFGNSGVDYHDQGHVARVRRVLEAANGYGMAVVVHMRASISQRLPYGRDEARIFLEELLPAAPDVTVQIAHLGGAGGYAADPTVDEVVGVFVEAVSGGAAPRLLFDVTSAVSADAPPEELALIARRIRELGVERMLYGSDAPLPGNTPRECWAAFRRLPLTEAEWRTIIGSVAPYMR